jgi:hypothetical protein
VEILLDARESNVMNINTWMPMVSAEFVHVDQDKNFSSTVSVLIADSMKLLFVSAVQVLPDMSVKDKFAQMIVIDSSDQLVEMIHTVN